jgi:predicted metallopeptidase
VSTALHLDPSAALSRPPFVLCWSEPERPLPRRAVRAPLRAAVAPAPPWLDSGPVDRPFDFCASLRRLCADVVARCDELRHIDLSRLLFAVTQARSGKAHGLQARVTPLRFHGGALVRQRRGIAYRVQRLFVDNREVLYLVTFCLPRFLNLDFDEKFITLFHELYHISPGFDGDLRRHGGRYSVHSHSQHLYDKHMAALAREYLQSGADPALHAFFRLSFAQLVGRHGSVVGVVVPRPKLIPVVLVG